MKIQPKKQKIEPEDNDYMPLIDHPLPHEASTSRPANQLANELTTLQQLSSLRDTSSVFHPSVIFLFIYSRDGLVGSINTFLELVLNMSCSFGI